jgi:hypothetical protein
LDRRALTDCFFIRGVALHSSQIDEKKELASFGKEASPSSQSGFAAPFMHDARKISRTLLFRVQ